MGRIEDLQKLKELNVTIKTNFEVTKILTEGSVSIGIEGKNNGKIEKIMADKIILTTGGWYIWTYNFKCFCSIN